jgi:hypothetical protein
MSLLYYSVQYKGIETSETDSLEEAISLYEDWCERYPTAEITLCEIHAKTIKRRKGECL